MINPLAHGEIVRVTLYHIRWQLSRLIGLDRNPLGSEAVAPSVESGGGNSGNGRSAMSTLTKSRLTRIRTPIQQTGSGRVRPGRAAAERGHKGKRIAP